MSVTETENL